MSNDTDTLPAVPPVARDERGALYAAVGGGRVMLRTSDGRIALDGVRTTLDDPDAARDLAAALLAVADAAEGR